VCIVLDRSYLDEQLIWKFFTQIVMALKECHRHKEKGTLKPILHRDIKPGNILLDTNRNVKLADFGLAKELGSQSKYARTNVGTPFYMSPEMTNSARYNEKSDIWAVGCLLYELAALRPPFEASNHLSLARKISKGAFARIPSRYSDTLFNTIRSMISVDVRTSLHVMLRSSALHTSVLGLAWLGLTRLRGSCCVRFFVALCLTRAPLTIHHNLGPCDPPAQQAPLCGTPRARPTDSQLRT